LDDRREAGLASRPSFLDSGDMRLLAIFLLSIGWAHAACEVRERAIVPLHIIGGTILAPVKINGIVATMVLDTGAGRSVVTREAVQRLRLALDEWVATTMRGVGGVERHRNANPRSIALGDVPLQRRTVTRDTSLTVASLPVGAVGGHIVDGLLGRDFLSVFDLSLDMPARRLSLYDVSGCVGRFLPWREKYLAIAVENPAESALVVPVEVNGKWLRALLDTGAASSLIAAPGMYRLGLTEAMLNNDPNREIRGAGPRGVTTRRHTFTSFHVGPDTLRDWPMLVAPIRVDPIVDMVLGADWMAGRALWISHATKQLFVRQ
jgi:hypothetical protein